MYKSLHGLGKEYINDMRFKDVDKIVKKRVKLNMVRQNLAVIFLTTGTSYKQN